VPEDVVVAILEVDYVGGRHAVLDKRHVIILDLGGSLKEVGLVAQSRGRLID